MSVAEKVKYGLKEKSFVILLVFCIQFTELKFDVIKITEILLLLLTPFLYYKKINKWVLRFMSLFILWFAVSIVLNPFRDFYQLEGVSILKRPYLITIGRFLELIACVNLMALTIQFLKDKSREEIYFLVKKIVVYSFVLLLILLVIYFTFLIGLIDKTSLIYENERLRGWFAEGGPYGLMLAFIFCLSFFYKSKYNTFIRGVIILSIIFVARSKAGLLLTMVWFTIIYHKRLYNKLRQLNIVVIFLGVLIILIVSVKISHKYIYAIKHVEKEMRERPTDINLVMGRIAGLYIFPEMVRDHLLFGIGLGNYPLMRNNPEYLGFIPHSPPGKTDAHGFGGIIQILVDGGLIFFSMFLSIFYLLFKSLKNNPSLTPFLYIFLFLFMFGVQIYFLYPWVLLGLIIALLNKPNPI